MKRTTKFLVLVSANSDLARDHCRSSPEYGRIRDCDYAYLRVVECKRENLQDNLVRVEVDSNSFVDFVEDINGNLYSIEDYWTKEEVINAFE